MQSTRAQPYDMDDFLRGRAIPRGTSTHQQACTNTSIRGGRWSVEPERYQTFRDHVVCQLERGVELSLTEAHADEAAPVLVDLDFRQACPTRLYSQSHVTSFVGQLVAQLRAMLPGAHASTFDCYVLEKGTAPRPAPASCVGGTASLKDGLHLHMPLLWTVPSVQYELRDRLLPQLRDTFQLVDMDPTHPPEDVYDKAVIEGPWLMYGSRKPQEACAWTVAAVHRSDASGERPQRCKPPGLSLGQFAALFSLRLRAHRSGDGPDEQPDNVVPVQHPNDEEDMVARWPSRADRGRLCRQAKEVRLAARETCQATCQAIPLDLLEDMIYGLPAKYHGPGSRERWMRVVFAIHTISEEGGYSLDGWAMAHSFSEQSPAVYSYKAVEGLWDASNGSVGAGSLVEWLKEDGLYAQHRERLRCRARPSKPSDKAETSEVDDALARIVQALVDRWPARFRGRLSVETFAATNMWPDGAAGRKRKGSGPPPRLLRFESPCGDRGDEHTMMSGVIYDDFTVKVDGDADKLEGSLMNPELVIDALDCLHHRIRDHDRFVYTRDVDSEKATLKCDARESLIEIHHPYSDAPNVRLLIDGKASVANVTTTKWLMQTIAKAASREAERQLGAGAGRWFNLTYNNHGATTINNYIATDKDTSDQTAYEALLRKLVALASTRRLRKRAGFVFKPVTGCPCGYEADLCFLDFVNREVGQDRTLLGDPFQFQKLLKYLEMNDEHGFPKMRTDPALLSFRNGVLHLDPSLEFLPYPASDELIDEWAVGVDWARDKTARHHIDAVYTGDTATPLLDGVLAHQDMPPDVVDMLYALMGRCLFPVGLYDQFDVMPFFLGLASTGKSTIIKVLMELFDVTSIGSISETMEDKFGLESLYDKELVECQDIPENMSRLLKQSLFQKMVCGERVSVAKKKLTAEAVRWTVPLIMGGNCMLDFKDIGGCISRRVVVFEFKHIVHRPDAGLLKRIIATELPNIAARILTSYFRVVKDHPGDVFWTFCPEYLRLTREVVRQETNYVARFLAANINEYSLGVCEAVGIERVEGALTKQSLFREAFAQYMRDNHDDVKPKISRLDNGALQLAGFVVEDNHFVCTECQGSSHKGCCAESASGKRIRVNVVHNMRVVRVIRTQ